MVAVAPVRAWTRVDAQASRQRFEARNARLARSSREPPAQETAPDIGNAVAQALAKARARRVAAPAPRRRRPESRRAGWWTWSGLGREAVQARQIDGKFIAIALLQQAVSDRRASLRPKRVVIASNKKSYF